MTDKSESKQMSSAALNEEVIDELTRDLRAFEVSDSCSSVKESSERGDTDEPKESSEEDEEKPIDEGDIFDEEKLKDLEIIMSDGDKEIKKAEAVVMKDKGNDLFRAGDYTGAEQMYTEGLRICPLSFKKERSIIYSNRAATKILMGCTESALEDCDKAVELNPKYLRALVRRAALREQLDQLDDALADWKSVLELDSDHVDANSAIKRLPPMIAERNEKLKEEMMDKLKSLGNVILRPFGLSTENFKLVSTEEGGYSIKFQQQNQN